MVPGWFILNNLRTTGSRASFFLPGITVLTMGVRMIPFAMVAYFLVTLGVGTTDRVPSFAGTVLWWAAPFGIDSDLAATVAVFTVFLVPTLTRAVFGWIVPEILIADCPETTWSSTTFFFPLAAFRAVIRRIVPTAMNVEFLEATIVFAPGLVPPPAVAVIGNIVPVNFESSRAATMGIGTRLVLPLTMFLAVLRNI